MGVNLNYQLTKEVISTFIIGNLHNFDYQEGD